LAVRVGCCGWAVKGGKRAYFQKFDSIEIQSTFYRLPRLSTARKWREDAPENFEFCVKAWQVITHDPRHWRRLDSSKIRNQDRYGLLKVTKENLGAWKEMKDICLELGARVCLFQTPPSFGFSRENYSRVLEFFSSIGDNRDFHIAWEPRGSWRNYPREIREICDSTGIIHASDPFRIEPLDGSEIGYLRLHGIGGREVNYSYEYKDEDLEKLLDFIRSLRESGKSRIYVFFNNMSMARDAERFKSLLRGKLLE